MIKITALTLKPIKPKQTSLEYRVCGSQLMKLMERAVAAGGCVVGCCVTSLSWVDGDKKKSNWFLSQELSKSQLWMERKWDQPPLRKSYFWICPHIHQQLWWCVSSLPVVSRICVQGSADQHQEKRLMLATVKLFHTACFGRSGGIFPLQIVGDFLSSPPGDILLSELTGKASFQWLHFFFPLD